MFSVRIRNHTVKEEMRKKKFCGVFFLHLFFLSRNAHTHTHQCIKNTSSVRLFISFINFCVKFLYACMTWWKKKTILGSFKCCVHALGNASLTIMIQMMSENRKTKWFGNMAYGTHIWDQKKSLLNELESVGVCVCVIKYLHTWFCSVHSHEHQQNALKWPKSDMAYAAAAADSIRSVIQFHQSK